MYFYKNQQYMNRMEKEIYCDPQYTLGAALFSGFFFSYWSWGIVYFLLFVLAWEIFVLCYCHYKGKEWDVMIRLGIIAGALMGFLMGRVVMDDCDHVESAKQFKRDMIRYMKALSLIDD